MPRHLILEMEVADRHCVGRHGSRRRFRPRSRHRSRGPVPDRSGLGRADGGQSLDSSRVGGGPADRVGPALLDSQRVQVEIGGRGQRLRVRREPQRHRTRRPGGEDPGELLHAAPGLAARHFLGHDRHKGGRTSARSCPSARLDCAGATPSPEGGRCGNLRDGRRGRLSRGPSRPPRTLPGRNRLLPLHFRSGGCGGSPGPPGCASVPTTHRGESTRRAVPGSPAATAGSRLRSGGAPLRRRVNDGPRCF